VWTNHWLQNAGLLLQSLLSALALTLLRWAASCGASQLNTGKTPAHKQDRQQDGRFHCVPHHCMNGAQQALLGVDLTVKCAWPRDQHDETSIMLGKWAVCPAIPFFPSRRRRDVTFINFRPPDQVHIRGGLTGSA
jgi:hypothetical protein